MVLVGQLLVNFDDIYLEKEICTQESCVCARVAPNAESLTEIVRSLLDYDCHMKDVCMPGFHCWIFYSRPISLRWPRSACQRDHFC